MSMGPGTANLLAEVERLKRENQRLVDPRHLVGIGDIARLFMLSPQTVSNWYTRRDRNGFPEAVAQLSATPVFDVNEVVRWYGRYVPSKGGRPGTAPRSVAGRYVPSS